MSAPLIKKTAQLKWLKHIKAEQTARYAVPNHESPVCDCQAWLKHQTRKQQVHKPKPVQQKPTPLLLVASAAPKNLRNGDYNRRFEQGNAPWYHIPADALQAYREAQIQAISYVAIGATRAGIAERAATHLYAVGSVTWMPRHMLTVEQSGNLKASDEPYWLFELTESVPLAQPITDFPQAFAAKIAVADQLLSTHSFAALTDVKENLYV